MPDWREAAPTPARARLALLACPVADSPLAELLPVGLREMGVEAEVAPFDVGQAEFEECVRSLAAAGFHGAAIDAPHRAAAARMAERFYEVRHSLGVANALLFREGVFGSNTEVAAFKELIEGIEPDTALVLGSGGAARTAVASLLADGWRVKVWAPNAMKVRLMANVLRSFGDIELISRADTSRCRLIVNATHLGKRAGEQPPVVWQNAMRDAVAFDFVFRRVQTEFLRGASLRGLRTIDGRELVVEAAALSLEWWFRNPAPRAAMRSAAGLKNDR